MFIDAYCHFHFDWSNRPENVKIIAYEIAEIKGDSFLKVAKQTTKNAGKLFWKK